MLWAAANHWFVHRQVSVTAHPCLAIRASVFVKLQQPKAFIQDWDRTTEMQPSQWGNAQPLGCEGACELAPCNWIRGGCYHDTERLQQRAQKTTEHWESVSDRIRDERTETVYECLSRALQGPKEKENLTSGKNSVWLFLGSFPGGVLRMGIGHARSLWNAWTLWNSQSLRGSCSSEGPGSYGGLPGCGPETSKYARVSEQSQGYKSHELTVSQIWRSSIMLMGQSLCWMTPNSSHRIDIGRIQTRVPLMWLQEKLVQKIGMVFKICQLFQQPHQRYPGLCSSNI